MCPPGELFSMVAHDRLTPSHFVRIIHGTAEVGGQVSGSSDVGTLTYHSHAIFMRVIFHYAAGQRLTRRLAALGGAGLDVEVCAEGDHQRFGELITHAEALWHLLEPVTADVIAAAPRLRLIQKIGVGVNTIDLDAARRRAIAVCNMPGTNSQAVAEMALLLILATLRRINRLDSAVRAGKGWELPLPLQDSFGEVAGRTVGLVGYGAVPRCLAPVLQAMGARVLFTCLSLKSDAVGEPRGFDALLAESDIVSLHVPLTAETAQLLNATSLSRMKPGAILVNTARGGLVDESALVDALQRGHVAGAGLDVFEEEPTPTQSALLALENVVLSPHVAWLTGETMERSLSVAVENCRRLKDDGELLHQVV